MFSRRRVRHLLASEILNALLKENEGTSQRLEARQLKDTIRGGYAIKREPYVRKSPVRRIRRQRNEILRSHRRFPWG